MPRDPVSTSPTLEEVAALAGVSRSTVSRVVNRSPHVTDEAVLAVEEAIGRLGYVPNRAARSLASRKTHVVALVVPESTAKVFADPFFASVVQGVALYLADTDYTLNLLIASETDSNKTKRYLLGGNVDGALVVSHHSGDHSFANISQNLPVVFGGRPLLEDIVESYYVDVDNSGGARMVTQHLIDSGRRRLATITGPLDMPPGVDRLSGWLAAVRGAGLADELIEQGDFTLAEATAAMRRILDRDPEVDGVFAASDQMAAGALAALRERGRRVPEDVAVAGFDGDYFSETSTPPLTTVAQPATGLGAKMAEVLVELMAGRDAQRVTMMPTELIVRASTRIPERPPGG